MNSGVEKQNDEIDKPCFIFCICVKSLLTLNISFSSPIFSLKVSKGELQFLSLIGIKAK